jgi:hypothetical protein
MFYGYRVVPGRGDETRSAEAFEVLNQPAKFARRFSLSLDHLARRTISSAPLAP